MKKVKNGPECKSEYGMRDLRQRTECSLLQDFDDHVYIHIVVHWDCILVVLFQSHFGLP